MRERDRAASVPVQKAKANRQGGAYPGEMSLKSSRVVALEELHDDEINNCKRTTAHNTSVDHEIFWVSVIAAGVHGKECACS